MLKRMFEMNKNVCVVLFVLLQEQKISKIFNQKLRHLFAHSYDFSFVPYILTVVVHINIHTLPWITAKNS